MISHEEEGEGPGSRLIHVHVHVATFLHVFTDLVCLMFIFSSSSQLVSSRSKLTHQDLEQRVNKVWKAITICFHAHHTHPYDSALLSTLSPLLVATLNSSSQHLSSISLSFWAVSFDKAVKLDYPVRLRDWFLKYLKDAGQPSELKLPGLRGSDNSITGTHKDAVSSKVRFIK